MSFMPASIRVVARFAALPELLAPLGPDPNQTDLKIDEQVLLRAQIAVEELFANSIHHGYGQECDDPVWLSVKRAGETLHVAYADAAAAFDPFSTLKPLCEIPAIPIGDRRIGGLGRLLVKELAQHCEYRRDDGRNLVLLEFMIHGSGTVEAVP